MKKLMAVSLLTVIISNNIAYANDINNTIDCTDNSNNDVMSEEILDNTQCTDNEVLNNEDIKDDAQHIDSHTSNEENTDMEVETKSESSKEVNVFDFESLKNALLVSGSIININQDIKVTENLTVDKKDITIKGNGYTIDLNKSAQITIKSNNVVIKDLNIKNSNDKGIDIYNSHKTILDNVSVSDCAKYGIFVNGSKVELKNCYTGNNKEGGIMITRSRSLRGSNHIDSYVEVVGSIKHDEHNINVEVKNLEMIDGYFQNNKFIVPDNIYNQHKGDAKYQVLSDYYLNLFNIVGEDRNKKYKEQSEYYISIQKVINVKENNAILDSDGTPIRLVGNGIVDETKNIEKLIEYAASHGVELYFPSGTYKITSDIDLSKINLPVVSNFTISGDKNGLTIIDGSSISDRMLHIKNEEYNSKMNYVSINNMVFNNIGIGFNGPYKNGISLNNNVFINGKYTKELDSSGNLKKAIMEPYIMVKNSEYLIEGNIFLRSKDYPGRGIATYRTKNTNIKDNYFGDLEGINNASSILPSQVINKLKMIKESSTNLSLSGNQGNFFTAINNERYDENINIYNNYFDMEKSRDITSNFGKNVQVSEVNLEKEGQRRDHIIYSKGYDGLNIYGNYFKGMENGAAGGVKIRNGNNAYIGSNHFEDVPLLTYIYSDLTKSETLLYNTTIYNNLFHCKTNFGEEGTGILYYQNFKDGDNLEFNDISSNGNVEKWDNSFGDVKNFVIYKNQFLSDDRDQITISSRAQNAYNQNEFLAYGNKYLDNNEVVNYNKNNLILSESNESDVVSRLNSGYSQYKNVRIPLTPAKVDYIYLNDAIDKANLFYNDIKNKGLIGYLKGQYSQEVADELKSLVDETVNMVNSKLLSQYDTNRRITLIEDTLDKLKESINSETIDPPVKPEPEIPDEDFDEGINVKPEPEIPDKDFDEGMNGKPKPEIPDKEDDDNLKTGESINLISYLLIGIASLIGIIFLNKKRK